MLNIKLSVTQLAEFVCRAGDLLPEGTAGPTAKDGIRAHKRVQKSRKDTSTHNDCWISELTVSNTYVIEDCQFLLSGRIDLVNEAAQLLAEIKTTLVPADKVPTSKKTVQWAQLYFYGYLYWQQLDDMPERMHELVLELIHFNIRDNSEYSEIRRVSITELEQHALQSLASYALWMKQIQRLRGCLVETAGTLNFPFQSFRDGQRDMAAAVYRASRDATALLCEAPTGVGKTMSSLYPAIKSMAMGAATGNNDGNSDVWQIVYLTAKVAGRLSAEKAMLTMRDCGLDSTVLQLRAKDTACFCRNGRCELDEAGRCPMTLGFYDRLPAARNELIQLGVIDNVVLDEIAWAHQLCPYELSRQLLPWVHVVIADFNYVFDPLVRLAHFANTGKNTVVLIDEAHNLVERARSMYSATLTRDECMSAAKECKQNHTLLEREISKLSRKLLMVSKTCESGSHVSLEQPKGLAKAVVAVLEQFSVTMSQPSPELLGECTQKLWRDLLRYAVTSDLFSDKHRCIIKVTTQIEICLFCLDASDELASAYAQFKASVAFSATLRPTRFYRDALGFDEKVACQQLASPFAVENCVHCLVNWVDTRYRQRDASVLDLILLIKKSTELKVGNYLVFLPSYSYLEKVYQLYVATYPDCDTWSQTRKQSKFEQQGLLESMKQGGHRIGFAIAGGVFGEGIDYKGDLLIGAIIVGTGMPAKTDQTELIAEEHRRLGRDGFDMAYVYPAFTRVLQTAGRVIRDDDDKGFVLLVDSRFSESRYTRLFPDTWNLRRPKNLPDLVGCLTEFWT